MLLPSQTYKRPSWPLWPPSIISVSLATAVGNWHCSRPSNKLLGVLEHRHNGQVLLQNSRVVCPFPAPPPLQAHALSPEAPATPLLAFFLRYPNPFARHVLCVDVLERTVDPETGRIRTLRLILKRGLVPRWASSWAPAAGNSSGRGLDAWVLEESIVDPPGWGVTPADGGEGYGMTPAERAKGLDYGLQPRLRVHQGNLSFKKFMHVIEGGELCAGPNG